MSAFNRFAGFGRHDLARATALFGCRSHLFSGRSRHRGRRGRSCLGFRLYADRRWQERCIERCRSVILAPRRILGSARAAFGTGTQAARGTRFANERIFCRFGDRLTLDRGHAFAGERFDRSGFSVTIAIAVKATVAITATIVAVFAGPIITGPIVTGAVFAWPVVTLTIFTGTIFAITPTFLTLTALRTFTAFRAVVTLGTLCSLWALFAFFTFTPGRRAIEAEEIAFDAEIAAVVFAVLLLPAFTALATVRAGALFFLPDARVGKHTEVVIGELQIVFGLHAIAIHVGVLRKLAILFEQLGGIAPCATVDPVLLLTTILGTITIATPPTAVVVTTIVIQLGHFLN